MHLSEVTIENFRAHSCTSLPLTQLGCLIGENNVGKSSVLHAIQFALEDRKITDTDFQNPDLEIKVTLKFEDISEKDLERVADKHRDAVRDIIRNGSLKIVRAQKKNEKATTKYFALLPVNRDYSLDTLKEKIKTKKGSELREAAIAQIPLLDKELRDSPSVKDVENAWKKIVKSFEDSELEEIPTQYPSGIAQAIKPLFPSVIYIEAVKDVSSEAKATGASAFSKLLEMLFNEISDNFIDINEHFLSINEKLNKSSLQNNNPHTDNRLSEVRSIETTIEKFIKESFPDVSLRLEIPAPTLQMLLSNATLYLDDGYHLGPISSKGDGLKRTVLFALLQTYAKFKSSGLNRTSTSSTPSYILLFEEPELYLHPNAKRQLMAAITTFSNTHQVLITTHSPDFFHADMDGFAKLQKSDKGVEAKPVNLKIGLKDAYQLIKYENNEAAFFAQSIVLVEGDSDSMTFPHLAKILNESWDNINQNIVFITIGGKGNIKRYVEFFNYFGVPVHVITDLDSIIDGFNNLTKDKNLLEKHSRFIESIKKQNIPSEPTGKTIRKKIKKRTISELWNDAQELLKEFKTSSDKKSLDDLTNILISLFDTVNTNITVRNLQDGLSEESSNLLDSIILSLAESNVYILRQGDLETYCNTGKGEKISSAIEFCQNTKCIEDFRNIHGDRADLIINELNHIFSRIYD
ncbi:AAA family ATPase [Actinomycetaceae bacterium TAE3-ERU4]|nr:AAA family ATPase [Actinomycetaceae bacterium TAE3-ERU4]